MDYHQILNTILFYKNTIIKISLIASAILFLILVFIYPRTYIGSVTILPPEKNSNLSGIGSLLGGADITALMNGSTTGITSQLYMEMLKSRSAAEFVIKKLNLMEYLNAEDLSEAAEKLSKKLNLDLNKEGIVKISVEVETPLFPLITNDKNASKFLAAKLANTYVEALDKINREKIITKAGNARRYLEGQIELTKSKMDSVENALMSFQQRNKTVSLPDQLKAVIEGASQLKSEIVETEVQIQMLQSNLQEDNKVLIGLKDKLNNLERQYEKMEFGSQDFLLAFKDVPELGREMAALLRDVKIQNEVYLILQQQYYKEKIQESRDIPTVEVLDEAIPPRKADSPKIVYTTILGAFFIFFVISMFFVVSEKKYLKKV